MTSRMILFSGNASVELAKEIAINLKLPLGKAIVSKFQDGESRIEISEEVRGLDVFIIQSTSHPINDNLIELLLMADALKRALAHRITAVIPYFGYARQDKRLNSQKVPIAAKVHADLLAAVNIDRVVTVDLHAEQIQGFFSMPVDNTYGSKVLLQDILQKSFEKPMIVSPDVGGVVRARAYAKQINGSALAIIDKRRTLEQSKVMNVVGDVKGKECIIVDDIVDTAGTLCHAACALKENQAKRVVAYCTHPVLSGNAVQHIENSLLDELVVTNTIPLSEAAKQCKRIRQLSIAPLLSSVIQKMSAETT